MHMVGTGDKDILVARGQRFTDIGLKISALIASLGLNFAIGIAALTPPATGYELSIYAAYPWYFYAAILISFSISLWALFTGIVRRERSRYTLVFVLILILLNFILMLLPHFRGYFFMGRHDALSHLGDIVDILNTYHVGDLNFYPVLHIMAAILLQVTGISKITLSKELVTPFFYLAYILFSYLIVRKNRGDTFSTILVFILVAVPVLSYHLSSFTTSENLFLLIPFFLFLFYFYLNNPSTGSRILLIIGLFLVPYTHPEIVFFLTAVFILYYFFMRIAIAESKPRASLFLEPIWILAISFFIWFSNSTQLFIYTRRVYAFFTLPAETSGSVPMQGYTNLLARAGLSTQEFADLILKSMGGTAVYLLMAMIIVLVLVGTILRRRKVDQDELFFSAIFCIACGMVALTFVADIIITSDRAMKFAVLAATLLVGHFAVRHFDLKAGSARRRTILLRMLCVVLIFVVVISTFNYYSSPIIRKYNYQLTEMETDGATWLVAHGDRAVQPLQMLIAFGRFVHYVEGKGYANQTDRAYSTVMYQPKYTIPDNFTYEHAYEFGSSYPRDRYLLTEKLIYLYYFELWPSHARFRPGDFIRLEHDPSVEKIYGNGEFTIHYIQAKRKK